MTPLRFRDEEPQTSGLLYLAAGAVLGLAAGLVVADRFGGFSALTSKVRERVGRAADEYDDDYTDAELDEEDAALEERVLEAFRNDPVLSERAVDIGAIGDGIIELTGWVHEPDEATHAVTITRGVPGVETVVNRLDVRNATSEAPPEVGDDPNAPLPGGRWEGQQVGTGKRRQGTSAETDRHADPKPELEDRWLSTEEALRSAAGDVEHVAERRRGSGSKRSQRGDRTGGSPIAPTGVPKADHVADPDSAPDSMRAD
jgi:hypothetical protein